MQPLVNASDRACLAAARDILAAVPEVMYYLRAAGRCGKAGGCTIPQIRTLAFLRRHPQTTISQVADCLGVTLPTASRLVETLVGRKMITRHVDPRDRRNVCLCLTAAGLRQLAAAHEWGHEHIAKPLRGMSPDQVEQVRNVMKLIQTAFRLQQTPRSGSGRTGAKRCGPDVMASGESGRASGGR